MKVMKYIPLLFIVAALFLGFTTLNNQDDQDKHPDIDWTVSCVDCHTDMTPDIVKDWEMSRHGDVGFSCYLCHGDGQETFYAKGSDKDCLGCHAAQEVDFEKSNVASCFDCHNGHTLKFHNDN